MYDEDAQAGEAASQYTDQFVDSAVLKLDSVFGNGYAKENPALVAAYITASSTNLSTFIQSALAMAPQMDGWEDMLNAIDEDDLTEN